MDRYIGVLGILAVLLAAYLGSTNRRQIRWRTVFWGLGLQVTFAFLVLRFDYGQRAMTWADLSCCYNEEARYQEALDAGAKAIALDAKLMEGWCNRGRAYMGLKQYKEGRDDYAAALALGPPDPVLVANLKANIDMADKYLAYKTTKSPRKP